MREDSSNPTTSTAPGSILSLIIFGIGVSLAVVTAMSCGSDGPECADSEVACDGECVDVQTDARHCGECDAQCPDLQGGTSYCRAGECGTQCDDPEEVNCDGVCRNLASDPDHCGGCHEGCAEFDGVVTACEDGTCQYGCDAPDESVCDDECVDVNKDDQHCGACDNYCAATERCVEGQCELREFVVEEIEIIPDLDEGIEISTIPDIAIDSQDRPHFTTAVLDELVYVSRDGGGWLVDVVYSDLEHIPAASIVLTETDEPRISFRKVLRELLYIARPNHEKSGWLVTPVIDDETGVEATGDPFGLAIDSDDHLHLVHGPWGEDTTYYISGHKDQWTIETVAHEPQFPIRYTTAVDEEDRPHAAYPVEPTTISQGSRIRYAYHDGEQWKQEDAASLDFVDNPWLAVSKRGTPHVAFEYFHYDTQAMVLFYTVRRDDGWEKELIGLEDDDSPFDGEWRRYPSIAVDYEGMPHVAFVNSPNLEYARRVDGQWEVHRILDAPSELPTIGHSHTTIELDSEGIPHIAFRAPDRQKLGYATLDLTD